MPDDVPPSSTPVFQPGGTGPAVNARHVIITAHGIRTFGQWQDRLTNIIRAADPEIRVLNYRYGYFSSVAFLIPPLRMLVTRQFRKALEAELALHPGARVDLVGHSFGTHLIGHGLRRIPRGRRPRVHTVLLAASVLKPDFPWRDLMDRGHVHRVINECGIRDNILILNQVVAPLTGMAGRVGFNGMTGDRFVNRYHDFDHGGYFQQAGADDDTFMSDRWTPLLTADSPPARIDVRKPGSFLQGALIFLLNNLEPIKLSILAAIFAIPFLIVLGLYNDEQKARQAVDRQLVVTRIRSVQEAWRNGQFDWGHELLTKLNRAAGPPGLEPDGFEIGHLRRLFEGLVRAETSNVSSLVALSPGGEWLAMAAQNGMVELRHKDPTRSRRLQQPGPPSKDSSPTRLPTFSADGSIFAFESSPGIVHLWDVARGQMWPSSFRIPDPIVKKVAFAPKPSGSLQALAISPDGSFLATSDYDGHLALWDLHAARRGPGPVEPRYLLSPSHHLPPTAARPPRGAGTAVRLVAHAVAPVPAETTSLLAFSPDGRRLVGLSADGRARLWDVGSRKLLADRPGRQDAPPDPRFGPTPYLTAATFSPDGRHLVVALEDGLIQTWGHDLNAEGHDLKATERIIRRHERAVRTLGFDERGRLISVAADGTIVVEPVQFDPAGPPVLPNLVKCGFLPQVLGRESYAYSGPIAALDHLGRTLAIPQEDGTVGIWDVGSLISRSYSLTNPQIISRGMMYRSEAVSTLHDGGPWLMAWTFLDYVPQGSSTSVLEIDDAQTGRFVAAPSLKSIKIPGKADRLAFAPTGKALTFLNSEGSLYLWTDPVSDNPPTLVEPGSLVRAVAFAPDGQTLAVAIEGGIRLVPIGSGRESSIDVPGPNRLLSLAFSPDGRTIAGGDSSGSATIWNVADRRRLTSTSLNEGPLASLAFDPSGDRLAAGGNNVVFLVDPRTGRVLGEPIRGLRGRVVSLAFRPRSSPGPSSLATLEGLCRSNDPDDISSFLCLLDPATVKLWDTETGQPLLDLGPGSGPLTFSPDGRTLASGRDFWSAGELSAAKPTR